MTVDRSEPCQYLSTGGIAARLGLSLNTVNSYLAKGMLPPPDAVTTSPTSTIKGWLPQTIDTWHANRPGRGNWRTPASSE